MTPLCKIAQTRFGIQSSLLDIEKGVPYDPVPERLATPCGTSRTEMDPDKLLNLVTQLNRVLGEQEERSRAQQCHGSDRISFTTAP